MSFSAPRGGMGGAPAAASAAQAAGPTTQPPAPAPPAQAPPARPSNVNTPPPRRAAQTQRRPGRLPRLHKDTGYFSDVEPVAAADLVSPLKAFTARDPTVKGGRWDPEFVWNTDWERALEASDRVTAPKVAAASAALEAAAEGRMLKTSAPAADFLTGGEGGAPSTSADLSSSRRAALADPALDLTASLLAPRSPLVPGAVPVGRGGGRAGEERGAAVGRRAAAASAAAAAARGGGGGGRPAWGPDGRLAPPAAPPAPVPVARAPAPWSAPGDAAARAAAAAEEAVAYEAMKRDLMAWTVGAGVAGTALAATFYSRDVALSYALGALGGAIYLRLLNKSVDGLGGGGGLGSASAGPPRLLVPVILAAGSNRYNTLVSASSGITLALLPMLVGFFTYKVAVVGRQGLILLGDLAADAGKEGRGK